LLLLG